ncbi:hypothetical protein RIF29_32223 [Crotalaria pallida]|uniref:Cytochrome P450 n=1 Tax=Crotalaria pallida TaxID=3830 RepID=A0AAN9HZ93_CROPI
MASSETDTTYSSNLPLKPIPGSYGLPFFGPISDRHDYFYHQGRDKFFSSRIQKYNSTVFKTNMPPGPFISSNPRVIALLDSSSFQILFHNSKVQKHDLLDGTFMPSTNFFGGYRPCAFLDTDEPSHSLIKTFFLNLLSSKHDAFVPLFRSELSEHFADLEDRLAKKHGKASFNSSIGTAVFNFVFRLICENKDPKETVIGSKGPTLVQTWLGAQLAPLATLNPPTIVGYLEDLVLRTVSIPAWTVKWSYKKLYEGFGKEAKAALDEAERLGIKREEATHNLVFMGSFNAFGGLSNQFPILIKWLGLAGEALHKQLADEIRSVVKEEGGITLGALEKLTLTKSTVYEALRIEPAVPFQYAKAREDLVIQSHDASFEIKKGEILFGYQPFATKDPKVFENPEEFVANRFVGDGEKLLKYVLWSNGRETEEPTPDNKQCPAKNLVVLMCRLFVVELFLRYDTFTVEFKPLVLGPTVTVKSLTKASSF